MPAPLFAPMKPVGAPIQKTPADAPGGDRNRPSIAVRLRTRWKKRGLDAALADGADPAASEGLALRAEQLADPATRGDIAAGIENLYRLATEGPGPRATTATTRAGFDRGRVAANRSGLAALAARLRDQGPHAIRGLAMASILLDDAESPLYARTATDELAPAVRMTIAALDPASPVRRKRQPDPLGLD